MSRPAILFSVPLVLAALALPAAAKEVPYLSGRVVDEAGLISPAGRQELEAVLAEHERRTSNQVVVLTVLSIEGEAVDAYAHKVAETWKLGQKERDNGALLLVSKEDRKLRIEVGYGLEGVLPDVLAGRIVRDEIVPAFKRGQYEAGIRAGVQAILAAIDGAYTPAPRPSGLDRGEPFTLPGKIVFGAMFLLVIGLFTLIGAASEQGGWAVYFFLIPFWAMFPMGFVGYPGNLVLLGIYLVSFPVLRGVLRSSGWGRSLSRRFRGPSTSRLWTTSRGSSWSSGGASWSSSSSSSFSGGGGSFGGGGASGSW